MCEAREKAFMVFGDVVLDTNRITAVIGTAAWMDDGRVLPIGYLAARELREWMQGGEEAEEEAEEQAGDAAEEAAPPPEKKWKRTTPGEADQWRQWRQEGLSVAEIAQRAGRSAATVSRILREAAAREETE